MAEAEQKTVRVTLADFAAQTNAVEALLQPMQEGRISHANLISGTRGIGKRTLARLVAQYLMCTTPTDKPCGKCPGCVQTITGNHPDVIRVAPNAKKSRYINVDMIRELNSKLATSTYEGGARVVLVEQADAMNAAAQNALLKNLEEPLPGTVFLMTAESPSLLLPTIISRCRHTHLYPWKDTVIDRVLTELDIAPARRVDAISVCGGSIGAAMSVAQDEAYWSRRNEIITDFFDMKSRSDLLSVSEKWKRQTGKTKTASESESAGQEEKPEKKSKKDDASTPAALLDDIEDLIRMLMLVRYGIRPPSTIMSFPAPWRKLAEKGSAEDFSRLLDMIAETRRLQLSNVTWQALLEKLLLSMMEEKSKWQE